MAPKRKEFTPEQIADGRRRYELTDEGVDSIAASFGLGMTRMHHLIGKWGWVRRRYTKSGAGPTVPPAMPVVADAPALQPEAPAADPTTPHLPVPVAPQPPLRDPVALGARLQQVVERELDAIDRVLGVLKPDNPASAERTARALASLARSLREVSQINDPERSPEAADDTVPRDLDQLRRDVGRRLDQLVAEAKALFADARD